MLMSSSTIGMRSIGHARKPPTITTMKVIPTVHQLRTRTFRVTVNHFRNFFRYCSRTGKRVDVQVSWHQRTAEYDDYFLDPRGGRTEVTFLDRDGNQYRGVSECSAEDLYNRKTGVMKAVAKAYADYLADNPGN
jgi:hypothetical protein